MKLLFCSANPQQDLELIGEMEKALRNLDVHTWRVTPLPNVCVKSLERTMQTFQPDIVHFCGHSGEDELIMINPTNGGAATVSPEVFAEKLRLPRRLTAVILNSCESLAILGLLGNVANWGIGTSRNVTDDACKDFTQNFYNRLSANRVDVPEAYSYALARLDEDDRSKFHLLNLQGDVVEDRTPVWARTLLRGLMFATLCLTVAVTYLSYKLHAIGIAVEPVLEGTIVLEQDGSISAVGGRARIGTIGEYVGVRVGRSGERRIEMGSQDSQTYFHILDKKAKPHVDINYTDDGVLMNLLSNNSKLVKLSSTNYAQVLVGNTKKEDMASLEYRSDPDKDGKIVDKSLIQAEDIGTGNAQRKISEIFTLK